MTAAASGTAIVSYGNIKISQRANDINDEVRFHWGKSEEHRRICAIKINTLVSCLSKENHDWSIRKIANTISLINEDLDGFATSTIYGNLNNDNKALLDLTKQPGSRKGKTISTTAKSKASEALEEFRKQKGKEEETKLQNNVMEPYVPGLPEHKVLEESSSSDMNDAIDSVYDLENETAQTAEPRIIYNDPQRIIKQYEQQNIELEKKYEDLEEKYNQIITPFEYRQTAIVNGQELPFLVKVNPYKREVKSIELDQNEVKKTK